MLVSKRLQRQHLSFFQKLVSESPEWQSEECHEDQLKGYLKRYDMLAGEWCVWYDGQEPIGITFGVEWAPSNEKAWIGTILIAKNKRRQGYGQAIIGEMIANFTSNQHDVLFAGVPIEKLSWIHFLSSCGFEQFKVEEDEAGRSFMIMVHPL